MAQKTCFVTIGATASFGALVKATLSAQFLEALQKQGYTDLLVQYGQDGKQLYESCLEQSAATKQSGLKVSGFDLEKAGLGRYLRQARSGVVISHAGIYPLHRTVHLTHDNVAYTIQALGLSSTFSAPLYHS